MKLKIKWIKQIPILQLFVIVMFLPVLMGQESCPVSGSLVDDVIRLLEAKFPPKQGPFYVTRLTFIDAKTRSQTQTLDSELINGAVVDGIQRAATANPSLKFNAPGHTIKDTMGNVNQLINLVFDPNLTPNERLMKIINEMMEPAHVDVIITGQFVDDQKKIKVKPFIIIKKSQKIVAKSLMFLKNEYICTDPVNQNKKALCSNAYEEIAQSVKELLLEQL
jgi:hypothetical protein